MFRIKIFCWRIFWNIFHLFYFLCKFRIFLIWHQFYFNFLLLDRYNLLIIILSFIYTFQLLHQILHCIYFLFYHFFILLTLFYLSLVILLHCIIEINHIVQIFDFLFIPLYLLLFSYIHIIIKKFMRLN